MKKRTKRAEMRARKNAEKASGMTHPGGASKYAKKNRQKEISLGHSHRLESPFYMARGSCGCGGG